MTGMVSAEPKSEINRGRGAGSEKNLNGKSRTSYRRQNCIQLEHDAIAYLQ
jgi:hypothetical protein